MRFFIVFLCVFLWLPLVRATHIMGGEITWKCQGNQYVFELAVYRDCNQTNISASQETIKVWNHPTTSSIQVFYVTRVDISPSCKPVTGSLSPITCGSGSFGGSGPGAVEKVIYRSNPISLAGIPPVNGWILTYDSFSRNTGITNLVDPTNHGITIAATIFNAQNTSCVDNSPQFLENPVITICKGEAFSYNMNAFDPDNDSLAFEFGKPLDNITNNVFNPPMDPTELLYEPGFSFSSPTPDASFDSQNQSFVLNATSGEISFLSHTIGNFVIKVEITSYKNGVKWSTIQREFQILVQNCLPTNNPPIIVTAPTINSPITVVAGGNVHIDFTITDNDLLQDGQPQTITVNGSGNQFGANFTSTTTGCVNAPCAVLSETAPIQFSGAKNFSFDWQTSCNHLLNNGVMAANRTYTFVIQAKDDNCQIPKFVYKTIQVNVKNPDIGNTPEIECVQALENGSYIITLKNTSNLSLPFYIKDQQNNTVATINSTAQTSVTVSAGNYTSFYISYTSGCGVGTVSSPSVQPIKLVVQNPQNGTAVLQWNAPSTAMNNFDSLYYIYREYPAGVWTLYDSIPSSSTVYKDTISICKAFIQYQVGIKHGSCMYLSTIEGDTLKDKIAPMMPTIASVSIDTLTGNAVITWSASTATDTYGYIIYKANENGILYEVDTVYGHYTTSYTHVTNTTEGAVTYSISAFDSCFTETVPITFQTSAKSTLNTSIFASYVYNPCTRNATVNWSQYGGWNGVVKYVVYKKEGTSWTAVDTVSNLSKVISLTSDDSASVFIKGINSKGDEALSNLLRLVKVATQKPAFHYTKVATVDGDKVILKHYIEKLPYMTDVVIERKKNGQFVEIARVPIAGLETEYVDADVNVFAESYTYRVKYLDSCGFAVNPANEVTTILLKINQVDEVSLSLNVEWSSYSLFDGGVVKYDIRRSINGVYDWNPVYSGDGNHFNFEDKLEENSVMNGKVCYYVIAQEGQNVYGFSEQSQSNEVCYVFEPIIYIPNAFTPDGLNPVFYPVINLANVQDYSMVIFDRWNNVVFSSKEINTGWDGKINNGKLASFGVYGYQITVSDGNGKDIRKTGHVTLIHSKQ